MPGALLLDVGGVVIRTPFELFGHLEAANGLPDGTLGARGPFADGGDDRDVEFARVLGGDLRERDYWRLRAQRAARHLDIAPETSSLIHALFARPEDQLVRPEVRRLVEDARVAGIRVGGFTNDLTDFHGPAWVERMTIFDELDVLVDGSLTGVLKPDRRAYELAVEAMGLAAEELVLLDDQPVNVAGARDFGMRAIQLDPTRPADAVAEARDLLGLAASGTANVGGQAERGTT